MDDADKAQLQQERELERAVSAARGVFDPGVSGTCVACGETVQRLIRGKCARCRDQEEGWRGEKRR